MEPSCTTCLHYRFIGGDRCVRDMKLITGQVMVQHNSGRMSELERNEKATIWRKGALRRVSSDICGKDGRHHEARR